MAAKEMYDYLTTIAADYDYTLDLTPSEVIPETATKNQVVHLADDNSEERVSFSDDTIFSVILKFRRLRESDYGTLFDLYCDAAKANGMARTFKWAHEDGHTYVVRFASDLQRDIMTAGWYANQSIRLKVLGRIADA